MKTPFPLCNTFLSKLLAIQRHNYTDNETDADRHRIIVRVNRELSQDAMTKSKYNIPYLKTNARGQHCFLVSSSLFEELIFSDYKTGIFLNIT